MERWRNPVRSARISLWVVLPTPGVPVRIMFGNFRDIVVLLKSVAEIDLDLNAGTLSVVGTTGSHAHTGVGGVGAFSLINRNICQTELLLFFSLSLEIQDIP